jgi:hypothetical protein
MRRDDIDDLAVLQDTSAGFGRQNEAAGQHPLKCDK